MEFNEFKRVVCFYFIALYGQTWTSSSRANLFQVNEGQDSTVTTSYTSSAIAPSITVLSIISVIELTHIQDTSFQYLIYMSCRLMYLFSHTYI